MSSSPLPVSSTDWFRKLMKKIVSRHSGINIQRKKEKIWLNKIRIDFLFSLLKIEIWLKECDNSEIIIGCFFVSPQNSPLDYDPSVKNKNTAFNDVVHIHTTPQGILDDYWVLFVLLADIIPNHLSLGQSEQPLSRLATHLFFLFLFFCLPYTL